MNDTVIARSGTCSVEGTGLDTALCLGACVFGLLALTAVTIFFPTALIWDEPWYIGTVSLLHEHGFTSEFLRSLPGPAGPLYTVAHYAFEPLTGLEAPGVRLVNVGLLSVVLLELFLLLRGSALGERASQALSLIAIPIIWTMSGLAMTELSAMAVFLASLLLLWRARHTESGWQATLLASAAGACLGAAILGRQPFAVALVILPVLIQTRRDLVIVSVAAVVTSLITLPVFWVWRGLVPPKIAGEVSGLAVQHGMLSFAFAAAFVLLLAPRFFVWRVWTGIVSVAMALGAQPLLWNSPYIPYPSVMREVVPPAWLPAYGRLATLILLIGGTLFVISCLCHLWRQLDDRWSVLIWTTTLALLCTPVTITHLFSVRYVGMVGPLLILVTRDHSPASKAKALRLSAGMLLGALSLLSYFRKAGAL